MTINVIRERTLLVAGEGGHTLLPGIQDRSESVEKTFVDAGFAVYVGDEPVVSQEGKMREGSENKMHPGASDNKSVDGESDEPKKRGPGRPRKIPVEEPSGEE